MVRRRRRRWRARGLGTNVYEVTAGVAIEPSASAELFSDLLLRPEVRADFADDDVFGGGTDRNQVAAALDVTPPF